jgi:hypothetical protein
MIASVELHDHGGVGGVVAETANEASVLDRLKVDCASCFAVAARSATGCGALWARRSFARKALVVSASRRRRNRYRPEAHGQGHGQAAGKIASRMKNEMPPVIDNKRSEFISYWASRDRLGRHTVHFWLPSKRAQAEASSGSPRRTTRSKPSSIKSTWRSVNETSSCSPWLARPSSSSTGNTHRRPNEMGRLMRSGECTASSRVDAVN